LASGFFDEGAGKWPYAGVQRSDILFAPGIRGLAFACERRSLGLFNFIRRLLAHDSEVDGAPGLRAGTAIHKDAEFLLHGPDRRIEAGIGSCFFPTTARWMATQLSGPGLPSTETPGFF
jgi:hypothetical protein